MKIQHWFRPLADFCREQLLSLLLFLGVLGILLFGLQSAQAESQQESLRIVEESILRTIVTCYAIEGFYPADLDYLIDQYGLAVDESQYYVQYEVFASNIMPVVTVIEVGR